jgi:hypothetical protein
MLSDDLRRILKDHSKTETMYRLAQKSGVGTAVLSRFLAGGGFTLESADKLGQVIGLEIVVKKGARDGR